MSCEDCITRRAFLQGTAATLAGASTLLLQGCGEAEAGRVPVTTIPVSSQADGTLVLDLATYDQLQMVGGSYRFQVTIPGAANKVLLSVTRADADNVIAVSAICTHLACALDGFANGPRTYSCNCHGSVFSIDGTVMEGPANRNLTRYTATLTTDSATVLVF